MKPENRNGSVHNTDQRNKRQELLWFGLILLAGLLPRVIFVLFFPTKSVSDFVNLLAFANDFRDDIFARGSINWNAFNAGTSFFLSLFLRAFPATGSQIVARTVTVLAMGLLPILPFLLWKDVFSLRTRALTAILMALSPALIIFAPVFSQDNWVLLPITALASLAVRIIVNRDRGHPVWASLLYVIGIAIRQEMLIVLLPLFIPAVMGFQPDRRIRNSVAAIISTGLLLSLLIIQRGVGSGRYALSTSHLNVSVLGSYVPGAGIGWVDPKPYIAATAPGLLENDQYKKEALHMVWKEISRRPRFHAIRLFASPFANLFQMEPGLAYWSLVAPDVLPANRVDLANHFGQVETPKLKFTSYLIHILFLGSLFFSLLHRRQLVTILPLFVTLLLKLSFHAVIVSQPRYFLTLIVLEILIIGVVSNEMFAQQNWKSVLISLVIGILSFTALFGLTIKAQKYIDQHDDNAQQTYRFPLTVGDIKFSCIMKRGRLLAFSQVGFAIDFRKSDPPPGAKATIECSTPDDIHTPLRLSIYDPYFPGGSPQKIEQIVYRNGVEVYRHDISAEPGEGWQDIALTSTDYNQALTFKVEVISINPDVGWSWGRLTTRILIQPAN